MMSPDTRQPQRKRRKVDQQPDEEQRTDDEGDRREIDVAHGGVEGSHHPS